MALYMARQLLTSDGQVASIHTCLGIKQVVVVLANDRYNRNLSLDSEVESPFLKW